MQLHNQGKEKYIINQNLKDNNLSKESSFPQYLKLVIAVILFLVLSCNV